jgi:hypothetical protein
MEKELGLTSKRKIEIKEGGALWRLDQFTTELKVNFTVDRFTEDNVDLSDYSCRIYFINTLKQVKKTSITFQTFNDFLTFTWDIDLIDVSKNNLLIFQISFEDDNYVWKSITQDISINNIIKILDRR